VGIASEAGTEATEAVLAGLMKEEDLTEDETEADTEAGTEAETETESESESETGFLTLLRAGAQAGRAPLFDLFS
jgi:hypothetical protein